jgi:uncharacterized membrane protein YedE/YeeE
MHNRFWSPYVAGAAVGLVLLAIFFVAGRGLGASGALSVAGCMSLNVVSPGFTGSLKYFSQYLDNPSPLMSWNVFMVVGVFLGALTGALFSGNFKIVLDKATSMTTRNRLLTAFAGGILIGWASRLARGCTSGVGLTGGAQLALSGWVFVCAVFVSGFLFAAIFRRYWS